MHRLDKRDTLSEVSHLPFLPIQGEFSKVEIQLILSILKKTLPFTRADGNSGKRNKQKRNKLVINSKSNKMNMN